MQRSSLLDSSTARKKPKSSLLDSSTPASSGKRASEGRSPGAISPSQKGGEGKEISIPSREGEDDSGEQNNEGSKEVHQPQPSLLDSSTPASSGKRAQEGCSLGATSPSQQGGEGKEMSIPSREGEDDSGKQNIEFGCDVDDLPRQEFYLGLKYARRFHPNCHYLLDMQSIGLYDNHERIEISGDGNCLWYSFGLIAKRMNKLDINCKKCGSIINIFKKGILDHMKKNMGLKFFLIDETKCNQTKAEMLSASFGCYDKEASEKKYKKYETCFERMTTLIPEDDRLNTDKYDAFDDSEVEPWRMGKKKDNQSWYIWAFCNHYDVDIVVYAEEVATLVFQGSLYGDKVSVEMGIVPKDLKTFPNQIFLYDTHYDALVEPIGERSKQCQTFSSKLPLPAGYAKYWIV